jgi:hypothetical protein
MISQGQILHGSMFQKYIDKIFSYVFIKNIVEIGTWKGLGSTKVIIDNIIKNQLDCNFISIESNSNFFKIAKQNLSDYSNYVTLLHGSICDENDLLNYISMPNITLTTETKRWFESDFNDLKSCPRISHLLPTRIDFLMLDGGEFSTYSEWNTLKAHSHIIALDDTKTFKCSLIKTEILNSLDQYDIIIDSNDRNGFMIVRNKYYEL